MATSTLDGTSTPYPIAADSTVTVNDGDTLILLGTIANQGTIFQDATGEPTYATAAMVEIGGTAVTLTGGGDVVLSQSPDATSYNENLLTNKYDPSASVQTLTNVDNTISGSGEILGIALDNEAGGVIDADGTTANALDIYANGFVNTGLIEATGIGGMFISSLNDPTVDQSSGGTILAAGAGVLVEMYLSDVIGGTLATTGGATIGFLNGTIDGSATTATITAGSTVDTLYSYGITLLGTIDNAGTLDDLGGSTFFLASPTVTLTGGGMVALGGDIYNADTTIANLLVNVDNTIAGSGYATLTAAGSGLTNDAAGIVDATGSLTFRFAGGAVRNAGLVEATTANGLLAFYDATIDNTGGTLLANAGTVTFDTVTVYGGAGSQLDASNGGAFIFYDTDTLGSPATGVTIGPDLAINAYGTLALASSIVSNAGAILLGNPSLYGSDFSFTLVLDAATTTLEGGGTIQFVSNDSEFIFNDDEIVGTTATPATLVNVDNTIDGSGEIGSTADPIALVNDASGIVNASGSYALTINSGTASVRNAGLMESTYTGGLVVDSPTLDNTGGTLLTAGNVYNGNAGTIALNGVDVIGGTLTTNIFASDAGPAQRGAFDFQGGGSTLDGRTQTVAIGDLANLVVESGSSLDLLGGSDWQGADLTVTGSAANAGTITGFGQIAGDLTNTGIVLAEGGAFDITGAVDGAGSLAIAGGGSFELGGASAEAMDFRGATGSTLILDQPSGYTGALTNLAYGDVIQLNGLDVASTQVLGATLALTLTDRTTMDFSLANLPAGDSFPILSAGSSGSTLSVECFAEGTRIRTRGGESRVENLRVGDSLPTGLAGDAQRIVWIGRCDVDCRRHPDPRRVYPVRVRAHAFGPGLPMRDLVLSPDHAVLVAQVLIPIKYLINACSIVQAPVERVTYYHVELARHDVVWAEGLPTESYLDTGNRAHFAIGGRLHPDVVAIWEASGCAPLVTTGPALAVAQAIVAAQLDGAAEPRSSLPRAA